MKPITIKNFHKLPVMLIIVMSIAIPVALCFLTVGICQGSWELILIGAIPLVLVIVGIAFVFNYGITINSKRVTLINQSMIKTFRYEDIVYIAIVFDNDAIYGEVRSKSGNTIEFLFDGIDLRSGSSVLSHLWVSNIKISKEFVFDSIEKLSACPKIKIKNNYRGV